jgi:hypothetical protein
MWLVVAIFIAGIVAVFVANGDSIEGLAAARTPPTVEYRVCLHAGDQYITLDHAHLHHGSLRAVTSSSSTAVIALQANHVIPPELHPKITL